MRYFLELSYNGANYRGWQRQKNAPSVQQTIEEALSALLGESIEVTGAGRTDTGVHAAYYVAHFDSLRRIEGSEGGGESAGTDMSAGEGPNGNAGAGTDMCAGESSNADAGADVRNAADFVYHANSILPPDIAIRGVRRVADSAHARFDAREREYSYRILPFKDPFRTATAWQYSVPLDTAAMNEAAASLLTASDFTTFAKLGGGNKTNICRVTFARWRAEDDGELVFTIRADRFLRNMVRAIVGTLVDVGRGKMTAAEFAEALDARDLSRASGGAPAKGLFLTDIKY